MAKWSEFVAAEPEFAGQVRACFGADRSETLATVRRDGSPRISGVSLMFSDGDLVLALAFEDSVKAADLRRDPRLAVHGPTAAAFNDDASDWPGEAKIAGYGVETVVGRGRGFIGFRVEVTEVVRTYMTSDHFVIESWHEGRGLQRHEKWYPREYRLADVSHWTEVDPWA
ncbi:MAG: pyridoxamine 5'-phosphate oxidase family protein [Pseudonocardiales bacterium]